MTGFPSTNDLCFLCHNRWEVTLSTPCLRQAFITSPGRSGMSSRHLRIRRVARSGSLPSNLNRAEDLRPQCFRSDIHHGRASRASGISRHGQYEHAELPSPRHRRDPPAPASAGTKDSEPLLCRRLWMRRSSLVPVNLRRGASAVERCTVTPCGGFHAAKFASSWVQLTTLSLTWADATVFQETCNLVHCETRFSPYFYNRRAGPGTLRLPSPAHRSLAALKSA
ncbi:hypothetical protein B0H15DRAFT_867434 [Mycena belliarum]|uniref:Uncharacterized protein n=1 Tax=Mycena belliarum TaxID=1033014 RepID=A0AAD6TNV3_9AGAR|nr:hypothetical protein B0H15DRAFT_867434 [Mycena belliae]